MKLDTNNHSVFRLYYPFVRMVVSYHITLVEWHHDKNHVHILFKAQPKTELTTFINTYKSASSRLLKRDFPRVNRFFGKKCFGLKVFAFGQLVTPQTMSLRNRFKIKGIIINRT